MKLTMVGRLTECILLVYRTPAKSVRHLLPEGLELRIHGEHAFWNIVLCTVDRMRPRGVPRPLGITYHHVAYRLHAFARTADGGTTDGLYFVRSDVDDRLTGLFGNVVTDFRFNHARIELSSSKDGEVVGVVSGSRDGIGDSNVEAVTGVSAIPGGSCFDSPEQAARLLKYHPVGLSTSRAGDRLKLAEVFRDEAAWRETQLCVTAAHWALFDELRQHDVALERATRVDPIDYRWQLGRSVPLYCGGWTTAA